MPLNTETPTRNIIPLRDLKSVSGNWSYEVKIGDTVELDTLTYRQRVRFHSHSKYLLATYLVQDATDEVYRQACDDWTILDIEGVAK